MSAIRYFDLAEVMTTLAEGAYANGVSTEAHLSMSDADGTGFGDNMREMVEQPASEARDSEGGVGGGGTTGGEGEGAGGDLGGEVGDQGGDMGSDSGGEGGGGYPPGMGGDQM